MEFKHVPVLLNETLDGLNIKSNGTYVDGTIGGAGHSSEILKNINEGFLIGIDKDDEAIKASNERLSKISDNYTIVKGNHDDIKNILNKLNVEKVDGILLDLGVSSYQIDNKERGFSYTSDDFLDMRMDQSQKLTAFEVVNKYKEKDLADIIYNYGEERFSRKIAAEIVKRRKISEIKTTKELADIVRSVVFSKNGDPSKKTFQAIRIEVNNELKPLAKTIADCIDLLKPHGRLCVITFHSLEDRAVKQAMKKAEGKEFIPPELSYGLNQNTVLGTVITKKPIEPTEEEQKQNPRSQSAKLRIFEKA